MHQLHVHMALHMLLVQGVNLLASRSVCPIDPSEPVARCPVAITSTRARVHGLQINASCATDLRHLLRRGRLPLAALPRRDALEVHGVDLLDGPALALDDEEVDDDGSEKIASCKDVTVTEVNGL